MIKNETAQHSNDNCQQHNNNNNDDDNNNYNNSDKNNKSSKNNNRFRGFVKFHSFFFPFCILTFLVVPSDNIGHAEGALCGDDL